MIIYLLGIAVCLVSLGYILSQSAEENRLLEKIRLLEKTIDKYEQAGSKGELVLEDWILRWSDIEEYTVKTSPYKPLADIVVTFKDVDKIE